MRMNGPLVLHDDTSFQQRRQPSNGPTSNSQPFGQPEFTAESASVAIPFTNNRQSPAVGELIQKALEQLTGLQQVMEEEEENEEYDSDDSLDEDADDVIDPGLAGYRFCAEETIRFLIEEEHFSPDDPVIRELQLHLEQQQSRFYHEHKVKQQQQTSQQETSSGQKGTSSTSAMQQEGDQKMESAEAAPETLQSTSSAAPNNAMD